jgi:hypothetical protein
MSPTHKLHIRGVMFDLARVTERLSYYEALPERLAAWGYNTIFFHFTDDQGFAVEYRCRDLATPHAWSRQKLRAWLARCASNGLTVVPEIESFGHTAYIHGRREYRHLAEPAGKQMFNALNPLHRESRAILCDLIEETAELFPASPYIHAGLDEVNFGASPQVKRALRKRQKWEIFADHVDFMHGLVARTGRRMIMWGDHLLHEPDIADRIDKSIIIADWHYLAEIKPDTVAFFTRRGFDTLCCPATNRNRDMILPGEVTQNNLQRFARFARDGGPRVLGLINTIWCPQRMLCGAEQWAVALGGAWFKDPEADPLPVVTRFLETQYGLRRAGQMAATLLRFSSELPRREALRALLDSNDLPEPTATACELAKAEAIAQRADACHAVFERAGRQVRCNAAEFANYVLAAALLGWAARGVPFHAGAGAPAARRGHLREGRILLAAARADWNRGRYSDDPKRDLDSHSGNWTDALIPNLILACDRMGARA